MCKFIRKRLVFFLKTLPLLKSEYNEESGQFREIEPNEQKLESLKNLAWLKNRELGVKLKRKQTKLAKDFETN